MTYFIIQVFMNYGLYWIFFFLFILVKNLPTRPIWMLVDLFMLSFWVYGVNSHCLTIASTLSSPDVMIVLPQITLC